jgi:hypothetical protein
MSAQVKTQQASFTLRAVMQRNFLFAATFLISTSLLLIAQKSHAQTAKKIKSTEEQIRDSMVTISRQLGITCTYCHNTDDFKNSDKPFFKIAKEHMRLTQILIDSGMDGKSGPKADCYMCHRGQSKPDFKEPLHPIVNPHKQSP